MRFFAASLFVIGSLTIPAAKADIVYTGSQAGFCCFDVTLHELTNAVQVTVSLTHGALYYVNTGSGNHPGFAFNLAGAAITAADISAVSLPWTGSSFAVGPVVTNGPPLGTFDYYFTNPGKGANAKNPGPLVFTVNRAGITAADFDVNAAGYLFAADILDASGSTGMSAISSQPSIQSHVPEPASMILLATALIGAGGFVTARRAKGIGRRRT